MYGGAGRIWWPGVSEESDPADHPLIFDPTGAYQKLSLERLARELRPAREAVDLTPELRAIVAERQLAGAQRRNDHLEKELRRYKRVVLDKPRSSDAENAKERDARRTPEKQVQPEAEPGPERANAGDPEGQLHRLICSEWVTALSPADRAAYPLSRYLLSGEFTRSSRRAACGRAD